MIHWGEVEEAEVSWAGIPTGYLIGNMVSQSLIEKMLVQGPHCCDGENECSARLLERYTDASSPQSSDAPGMSHYR